MRVAMAVEIQEDFGYDETLAVARLADESHVGAVVLAEHYCSAGDPHSTVDSPDAWIYLGALARETRRVRIGTLVSPVTFRHPAVYAKMAATLDLISGGRAELGLGAGWLGAEHSAYGFAFPDGPTRVSMVAEQLEIIRGLWGTDGFSFQGRHYSLHDCSFTPRVHGTQPPILVGGRPSSSRLLSLAARFADEYVLTRGTPEDCRLAKEALAARSERHRALPGAVRLGLFARLAFAGGSRLPYLGKKTPAESDDEWIVGSSEAVRSRLRRFRDAGVDSLYISVETLPHAEDAVAIAEMVRDLDVRSTLQL